MIILAEENIIPHIQVHDELNLSLPIETRENTIRLIKEIMEKCIELKIPSKVEPKIGASWGNLKKIQLTPMRQVS